MVLLGGSGLEGDMEGEETANKREEEDEMVGSSKEGSVGEVEHIARTSKGV